MGTHSPSPPPRVKYLARIARAIFALPVSSRLVGQLFIAVVTICCTSARGDPLCFLHVRRKKLCASAGELRTNMKLPDTMAEIRALTKRAMYVES